MNRLLLVDSLGAITINFFIPRLMRGDAIDTVLGQVNGSQVDPRAVESLRIAFGLDKGLLVAVEQIVQPVHNINWPSGRAGEPPT